LKDLQEQALIQLKQAGFKIDYVSLCNDKLEAQERWDGKSIVQALIAAYLNEVRLIDNMCVSN
jgi:pantoate--beta-alanine ligase